MEEKDAKKNASQVKVKGKGKGKKKVVNLDVFAQNTTQHGFAAVPAMRWSDVMDGDDEDINDYGSKNNSDVVLLPTAPKAIRGPDIDINQVPNQPPFSCYLSNLPFQANEDDVRKFFKDLKIIRIELFRDPKEPNRAHRGQGVCEFADKQNLIDAFTLNQESINSRPIRLSLRTYDQERGDYRNRDRDDKEDRTAGDWRAGKSDFSSNRPQQNYQQHDQPYANRNRDYNQRNYGDRSNYNNNYNNMNRNDRNERNDYSQSNRNEYSRDHNSQDGHNEFRRDEPPRERPRLMLQKRTEPLPQIQQQPLDQPPKHQQHSSNFENDRHDRSESESSETSRKIIIDQQQPEKPVERKRLLLLPKSKKDESENKDPVEETSNKSSIFGEAKPVDTQSRLLEIETKVKQHEKEIEEKLSETDLSKIQEKLNVSSLDDSSTDRMQTYDNDSSRSNMNKRHDSSSRNSRDSREFRDNRYQKPRSFNDRNVNRMNMDNRDNYRANNKYNNLQDRGNRNMNNHSNNQDYDQRPNRMGNNRNRQNQENTQNFQQINKFNVLKDDME